MGLQTACFDPASAQWPDGLTIGATTDGAAEGSSSSSSAGTTASADPGTDPSTTEAGASTGTETGTDGWVLLPFDPPEIEAFAVDPSPLIAAGPLTFTLAHSDGVEEIELVEPGVGTIATITPAELPYALVLNSAEDNGTHIYQAIVRDGAGLSAAASAAVDVNLPKSGQEVWSWEAEEPKSHAFSIFPLDDGALVAGYAGLKDGPHPRITRLNSAGGVVWERAPIDGVGYAVGVVVQPGGRVVAVGNRAKGGTQAMWMRALELADGEAIAGWGADGLSGERGLALAVDAGGDLFVAGDTVSAPFDLCAWAYAANGEARWSSRWSRLDLDVAAASHQARALVPLAGGELLVAGTTTGESFGDSELGVPRALILRFSAAGAVVDAWIDDELEVSWLRALIRLEDGDLVAAGAAAASPGQLPQAMTWRIDGGLDDALWRRALASASADAMAVGAAARGDDEILVASTVNATVRIIRLRADGQGPALWQKLLPLGDGPDQVEALALGRYGYIHLAGEATLAGVRRSWATRLAP